MCHKGHILPNVFLIGAQKAGSSSLWRDIKDHFPIKPAKPLSKCVAIDTENEEHVQTCGDPNMDLHECPIKKSSKISWGPICEVAGEPHFMDKEVHFFDNDHIWARGGNNYLKHWPKCKEEESNVRTMDATPNYLQSGEIAAKRLKAMYADRADDLHFVVIVRNPAKRMESGYWHFMPYSEGDFDTFVDGTADDAEKWIKDGGDGKGPFSQNPYAGSLYARNLKSWMTYFKPSQFSVITLQEYTSNPQATLDFISQRTGIPAHSTVDRPIQANLREHPKMTTSTEAKLTKVFKKPTEELEKLVSENGMSMSSQSGARLNEHLKMRQKKVVSWDMNEANIQDKSVKTQPLWDMTKPGAELSFRQLATSDGQFA